MSLFYDCNECKEKEYVKENVIRASNQLEQQAIVDQQIAESLGLDVQASALSKLAKRVINSIGSELLPTDIKVVESAKKKLPTDYLLQAITTGKLSQLFDRIKAVPKSKLSKKAQVIQDDLKNNQILKDVLNEDIAKIVSDSELSPEEKPAAIKQAIVDDAAGGDGKVLDELVDAGSNYATSVATTWAELYKDFPETLKRAEATIDIAIQKGNLKDDIRLLSNNKLSKPTKDGREYSYLDYGTNNYIYMSLTNDGPEFYTKANKGNKADSINYNNLKSALKDINITELINSLSV